MADSSDANLGLQHPYDINQRHDVFAVHTGINSDVPEGWFDPQWDYSPQSTDFKLSLPIALGISAVDGSIGVDASVTVHHEPSAPWHALDTNRNTLIDPCAGGVREGQSILMPAQTQVDDSTNMSGAQHGLSVNHPHDHVIDTTTQASTHDRWVNPPWIITPDQSQRISSFPASTMPGQPLMYHDITPLHQTPSILVNVPTTTQVPCATILSSSRPTAEAQVVSVDHAANPPFGMTGGQLSVNALATIADGDSMQPPRGIKRSVGNMYVNAEICRPSDGKRRAVCFVGQADSGIAKARRVQLQLQRDIEKCLDYWGYEFQAEEYLETSTRNATKLKYRHGPGKRAWNEVVRAYQRWLPNACTSIPDISWPELPPIHDELQAGTLGLCHDVWYAVSQSLKTLVTFPSKKVRRSILHYVSHARIWDFMVIWPLFAEARSSGGRPARGWNSRRAWDFAQQVSDRFTGPSSCLSTFPAIPLFGGLPVRYMLWCQLKHLHENLASIAFTPSQVIWYLG